MKRSCGCEYDMMVENFYQKIGREIFLKREKLRNSIKTINQWEKEKQRIMQNLEHAIGEKFPEKDVRVIHKGEVRKHGLLIKKIVFSLHKDHWVPALVYIPSEYKTFLPGVLLPAGHCIQGKFGYNELAVLYAKNGYVAITYDFVGQGERAFKDKTGFIYAFASTAHNIVGIPMTLYGYNLNWFQMFESIAAVDVLLSTGIVDATRIGITGGSGGGINSFYTAAFDRRISALAPAASVHSFYDRIYMDDCEQSFFDHIEKGLDFSDVISFLIAPRPIFIVANLYDIWSIDGTKYTYETAKRFYHMHNAEKNLKMNIYKRQHGYDRKQQTDVLLWFNKIFKNGKEFVPYEKIEKSCFPSEKELCVLPEKKQQSFYLKNPLSILAKNVKPASKPDNSYIQNITEQLADFVNKKFYWEIIDRYPVGNREHLRIVYSPEKGILLPAEIVRSEKPSKIVIFLDETLRTEKPEKGIALSYEIFTVIRPDLRGCGEASMKESWEDWENWCQNNFSGKNFKLFILCHLLGKRLPVERAKDIICLVSIAKEIAPVNLVLHAYSITAISAILAGIVDKRIDHLILEEFLYSYKSVFEGDYPVWKADVYLEGILKAGFDIKQLCSMVKAKKIEFKKPLDGIMKSIKTKDKR